MKKMLLGVLIGVVICGAGYMITHKNTKPVESTAVEDTNKVETKEVSVKEEPKEEKIKVDYSRSIILINGKQYEIGLDSGKLHIPNKNDQCAIKSFQLNYNDDALIDILDNPNMDYHPVWLVSEDNTISAVAFLYKGEAAILKLENNKFRFAIGTEEITDKKTLDKVAMSIFGEEYYWDAINGAISRQQQIKTPPQKKYTNDFDGDMERSVDKMMDDLDRAEAESMAELELQKNIAEDEARKAQHEIENAFK